jgi:hypothetical protein
MGEIMAHIDRAYVLIALILLVLGEILGLYMGIANDMSYRSVHITAVLAGFVTLSIYGFVYRLWPELKTGPLAVVQFWLGVLSAIGLIVGAYHFSVTGGVAIAAPASLATIAAAALLLWLFWSRAR